MNDTVNIAVDGNLWHLQPLWADIVAEISRRFVRVRQLDTSLGLGSAVTADELAAEIAILEAWAQDDIDWIRAAVRYVDENASRLLRPNAQITQPLRTASKTSSVIAWTALPIPLAEAVLRHVGVLRSLERIRTIKNGDVLEFDDLATTAR